MHRPSAVPSFTSCPMLHLHACKDVSSATVHEPAMAVPASGTHTPWGSFVGSIARSMRQLGHPLGRHHEAEDLDPAAKRAATAKRKEVLPPALMTCPCYIILTEAVAA